jgi:hypothetical protein
MAEPFPSEKSYMRPCCSKYALTFAFTSSGKQHPSILTFAMNVQTNGFLYDFAI